MTERGNADDMPLRAELKRSTRPTGDHVDRIVYSSQGYVMVQATPESTRFRTTRIQAIDATSLVPLWGIVRPNGNPGATETGRVGFLAVSAERYFLGDTAVMLWERDSLLWSSDPPDLDVPRPFGYFTEYPWSRGGWDPRIDVGQLVVPFHWVRYLTQGHNGGESEWQDEDTDEVFSLETGTWIGRRERVKISRRHRCRDRCDGDGRLELLVDSRVVVTIYPPGPSPFLCGDLSTDHRRLLAATADGALHEYAIEHAP